MPHGKQPMRGIKVVEGGFDECDNWQSKGKRLMDGRTRPSFRQAICRVLCERIVLTETLHLKNNLWKYLTWLMQLLIHGWVLAKSANRRSISTGPHFFSY